MANHNVKLPPGFRFHPTDEELVVHFLHRKAALLPCHPDVIPDLDVSPLNPWDLDGKALGEGNQWYFYSRRTQSRINGDGYWKALGSDEPVITSAGERVGTKKTFAFYLGEAPSGVKTSWIMQEYRLSDSAPSSSRRSSKRRDPSKWVVCRVYERGNEEDEGTELSCLDEVFLSLDDLDDISWPN